MNTLQNFSEAQLLHEVKKSNENAIGELLHRNKKKIYTAIVILVKDEYIAEDIFQDTCIKVINSIREGKYKEDGKFLPWAVRIARNLCMDYFRIKKRMTKITLPDGRDICALLDLKDDSVERSIIKKETQAQVRNMLEFLPFEQCETIVLRMYGNLSFSEIAELTGTSVNTALGRMRYGLINLRKVMDERGIALRV